MDSMQLLRRYRDAQPEPTADDLTVMRARMERAMTPAPARSPSSGARTGLAFGLLAGAVAAGVVVSVVVAGPAPQASAAAVRLLRGASSHVGASAAAPTTLVVREDAVGMLSDSGSRISAGYVGRTVTTVHVPVGNGQWTRSRYSLPTVTFFGGAAGRAFAAQDQAGTATKANPVEESSRDGSFTVGELGGPTATFGSPAASLRDLPTDPTSLLKILRTARLGEGDLRSEGEHVMAAASIVLESGVADGTLQAAVFAALQQQPDLTVTDRSADLDGRTGTAIGIPTAREKAETFQLIIDPATGQYLGHREVALVATGVVPAGTVLDSTAVDQY